MHLEIIALMGSCLGQLGVARENHSLWAVAGDRAPVSPGNKGRDIPALSSNKKGGKGKGLGWSQGPQGIPRDLQQLPV